MVKRGRGRPRKYSKAEFRRVLRLTGSISQAARACGMSRAHAYSLAKAIGARIRPIVTFETVQPVK